MSCSTRRSDRRCGQQPQKAQRTLLTECQVENSISSETTTKTATANPDSSKLGASLIPKLSRLQPNEISNAMQGSAELSGILSLFLIMSLIKTLLTELSNKFWNKESIYITLTYCHAILIYSVRDYSNKIYTIITFNSNSSNDK